MRSILVIITLLIAQITIAQDYRDIAYDCIMRKLKSEGWDDNWRIISDNYEKLPNGGYLITMSVSRTQKYYEDGLVNNKVYAYGHVFNIGVRKGLIAKTDTQTRRYIVFADSYGKAHNLVLSPYEPHFNFWNNKVWIYNKGRFDDNEVNCDCNFACFSYNGDLLWEKKDIAVFDWKCTGTTLYLVGNYIDNKRSFVATIDTKTLNFNEKTGNSDIRPYKITFEENAVSVIQKDAKSNITSYNISYAKNDRKFQIEQVLKKYDINRASDQIALGERYLTGNIIDKDERRAVALFEKAANQNSDIGMFKLAECYKKGVGVTQDYGKAFSLYEKSANMGNTDAMMALSEMYINGEGIEANLSNALFWKERLAFLNNTDAQNIIIAHCNVEYIHAYNNATEILEFARMSYSSANYPWARYCYERAISLGNKEATFEYGKWLYEGNGITRDCDKAVEYLERIGEEGDLSAQKLLIKIFHDDAGVAPNINKEMYWVIKAADNNDNEALFRLAQAYKDGIGIKKNKKLSNMTCIKAAECGNQGAITEIVIHLGSKKKTEKRLDTFMYWFKKMDVKTQVDLLQRNILGAEDYIKMDYSYWNSKAMTEYMQSNSQYEEIERYILWNIRRYNIREAYHALYKLENFLSIDKAKVISDKNFYRGLLLEQEPGSGAKRGAIEAYTYSYRPEAIKRRQNLMRYY